MYCLYFHYRPDGEIFYVGIGSKSRAYDFAHSRNIFWHNVVNKYGNPIVKILLEDISWTHACYAEKWCIKMYGRRDLKTGTLVNLTDGGDGVPGWGTFEIRSYIAKRRYLNISTDTINAHAHKMRIARTHQCMVISAKTRWKNKSNEQLEAFSKAISESAERRFSNLTAEQKSELSYKSKETMGPEARSLAAKKGKMTMTPEQRSNAVRKSWETRKKKLHE